MRSRAGIRHTGRRIVVGGPLGHGVDPRDRVGDARLASTRDCLRAGVAVGLRTDR